MLYCMQMRRYGQIDLSPRCHYHQVLECIFVNDVRPKRRKNNQVQRIVKRPAGVEREGRSEAEERPNEARRAARRGEIIAR